AKHGDDYGDPRVGQICIASAAARQWVLTQVTTLIDAVQPDYLKWDNNFWINCDRAGHGHGTTDGNFAHVNALYEVLDALRTRYPAVMIENVSGGGERLGLGRVRGPAVAGVGAGRAPAADVRRNREGVGVVL